MQKLSPHVFPSIRDPTPSHLASLYINKYETIAIAFLHMLFAEVVEDLLDAEDDELDSLFSLWMRKSADAVSSTRGGRLAFLRSRFIHRVLTIWAHSISLTVFDME